MRDAREAVKGRLPGSLNAGDPAVRMRDKVTEDFVPAERVRTFLSEAGLDHGKEIIVYGNRGSWVPYFAQFALNHYGVERVRVFHGGIEDWRAAGLPLDTGTPAPTPPTDFQLRIDPTRSISTGELTSRASQLQVIDARTPKEYRGEDIRAVVGGHIPGALNIPYEQNWADPDAPAKMAKGDASAAAGLSLKPGAELARLYASLDKGAETVVYCQSGARASETAGILRELGFSKVRVYDSSWIGYAVSGAPVAKATPMDTARLEQEIERWSQESAEMRSQLNLAASPAVSVDKSDRHYGSILWARHRAAENENKALRQQKGARPL